MMTINQRFFFCAFLSALCSCQNDKPVKPSNVAVGPLTWTISADDKFVEMKGSDSYVAYLIDGRNDTLHIEYGSPAIINNLYVPGVAVFAMSSKDRVIKDAGQIPTADQVVFSEDPKEDADLRIFEKNYWLYDTINGIVSKVVQPKKIGDGITGIYIPKLKDGMSFSMFGQNLDSAADQKALVMFRRIQYKADSAK